MLVIKKQAIFLNVLFLHPLFLAEIGAYPPFPLKAAGCVIAQISTHLHSSGSPTGQQRKIPVKVPLKQNIKYKKHPRCHLKHSIPYGVTSYYLFAKIVDLCWVGWAMMGSRGTQTDHRSGDLLVLKHLTAALVYNFVGSLLRFQVITHVRWRWSPFFHLKASETIHKSPVKCPG